MSEQRTISDQIIISFDATRKIMMELKKHDVQMDIELNKTSYPKLVDLFAFNEEIYTLGKFIGDRYIKQLLTIESQKTEIERLKSELEKTKEELKTIIETEPRKC